MKNIKIDNAKLEFLIAITFAKETQISDKLYFARVYYFMTTRSNFRTSIAEQSQLR